MTVGKVCAQLIAWICVRYPGNDPAEPRALCVLRENGIAALQRTLRAEGPQSSSHGL